MTVEVMSVITVISVAVSIFLGNTCGKPGHACAVVRVKAKLQVSTS